MKLSPSNIRTILLALHLAREWESSVVDSYGECTDPVFVKQREDSLRRIEEFKRLSDEIKRGGRKQLVRLTPPNFSR